MFGTQVKNFRCLGAAAHLLCLQHVGHAFERLVEVHEKHVRRVKKEVMFVQNRVEQLRKIDAEVESNIRAVKSRKEERSEELRNLVKDMESNLVSQLHRKLSLLLGKESGSSIASSVHLIQRCSSYRSQERHNEGDDFARINCARIELSSRCVNVSPQ